jgi:hypothetical protein
MLTVFGGRAKSGERAVAVTQSPEPTWSTFEPSLLPPKLPELTYTPSPVQVQPDGQAPTVSSSKVKVMAQQGSAGGGGGAAVEEPPAMCEAVSAAHNHDLSAAP